MQEFSGIDGHRFPFFPDTLNIWNNLPTDIRTFEDLDLYSTKIQEINLTSLRYNTRVA